PEMVKRDDSVTLIYEAPGILLTTRAKALESGAEGDVVSVVNMQTKRTMQGMVTAPGRVTMVSAAPRIVAAITPAPSAANEDARARSE
ncbi:MAG: flagellar basal body P-ring formation chaperone FlgA, partial [Bradyrhizobium sp.]